MKSKFDDYKRFPVGLPIAGSVCDPDSLGYVYVIGFDEPGIVKIGSTKNIVCRLNELQCGNPFELKALAAVSIYEGDPLLVEFAAHKIAQPANIRGEWFELETDDAIKVVIKAARNLKAKFGAPAIAADLALAPRHVDHEEERRKILRRKLGMDESEALTDCASWYT